MGFRFRRSIKLFPGVRLNVGKKSASISVGGRGGRYTFGTAGSRASASIPGTGIGYSKKLKSGDSSGQGCFGCMATIGMVFVLLLVGSFLFSPTVPPENAATTESGQTVNEAMKNVQLAPDEPAPAEESISSKSDLPKDYASEINSPEVPETTEPEPRIEVDAKAMRNAAEALRAIKRHLIGKDDAQAKEKLQGVVERYPGTPAAEEAAEVLQGL